MVGQRLSRFARPSGWLAITSLAGACANAQVTTPDNIHEVLDQARPGQRIVLNPGNYGALLIAHRDFKPRLEIDASKAVFKSLIIRQSSGINLNGGEIAGSPTDNGSGVLIDFAHDVTVSGMHIGGPRIGLTVSRSQGVDVLNNDFDGTRSDGVNIAMSQRVRIEGNLCHNFKPIHPIFDQLGKILHDGDHPDCIQGWSRAEYPPTADITIIGNTGEGLFMQGISFFDPGQGGYDRIIVRNNKMSIGLFNGVVLMEARNSEVTNNIVRTLPGARMLGFPFRPVTAWVKVTGSRNRVCGNTVDLPRFSDGTSRC